MYNVKVQTRGGGQETFVVEGWSIGQPEGFLQLVGESEVTFVPLELVAGIVTPRLEFDEEGNVVE